MTLNAKFVEEIRHFSVHSPRYGKKLADTPFDENRVFPQRRASTPQLPSPPMAGRPVTTQELISIDRPSMPPELDDINFGPVDSPLAADRGYSLRGDRERHQRSSFEGIGPPPINDLKAPDVSD